MFFGESVLKNARGISLLELSIVLPIMLLVVVGGVADYGRILRERQVIQDVTRDAGRSTARFIATIANPHDPVIGCVPSGAANVPLGAVMMGRFAPSAEETFDLYRYEVPTLPSCTALEGVDPITIGEAAKKSACERLKAASLRPDDWDIEPELIAGVLNDTNQRFIRVKIKGSAQCVFCVASVGDVAVESVFPVPVARGLSCGGR